MIKRRDVFPAISIALVVCVLTGACRNFNNIPFPGESGFSQPQTKPLAFSKPETINWIETDKDSIKPFHVTSFNFDKLPSKPFNLGGANTLLHPPDEIKFDWNAAPQRPFDLNKLPTSPLVTKAILIDAQLIKAGLPHIKEGASRGVMEFGVDAGIIGKALVYLKDKDGMMWIGTDKGLCRFDGENYEFYVSDGKAITALFEDKQGRLWCGTGTGNVYIFNRSAGLIKEIAMNTQRNVLGFLQDTKGQIWITNDGTGVHIIDLVKETIKEFGVKQGLSGAVCIRIMQDRQGLIWINTANDAGITVVDQKEGKIKYLKSDQGISENNTICTLQDEQDRIWVGGFLGVDIIDFKTGTIKQVGRKQGLSFSFGIFDIMQDKRGSIWIGTDTGTVYKYDEKRGLIEEFDVAPGASNIVIDITEDNDGQVWMAVQNAGGFFINSASGRPGNYSKAQGLTNNRVWDIIEDKEGNIWIGTYEGIDVYNPVLKTLKHIGEEEGLRNRRISTLLQDREGRILVVGDAAGLSRIDKKKGTIEQFSRSQGLSDNNGANLLEDKNGLVWMSTYAGVVQVIDMDNRSVKKLPPFKINRLNTLTKDRKGQVWLGIIGGGVEVIDAEAKTISHLSTANGLASNKVYAIREDQNGRIWIGSEKGLDIADLQERTITTLTAKEGLASPAVFTLIEKDGLMYAGTGNGLSVIIPPQKSSAKEWNITSYGKEQGLSFLDFNQNAGLLTSKGQLWFGIENEVLTIMDEPQADTFKPRPYVTGVNIMDKSYNFYDKQLISNFVKPGDTIRNADADTFYVDGKLPIDSGSLNEAGISWDGISGPYNLPENLQLPYEQNFLNFRYNAAHFSSHEKTVYRYILDGIDKKWSDVTTNTYTENYRNLPPGNYIFKVSSKGMNGVWSTPAEFHFAINPPFWKTWWAWLIYCIIATFGIVAAFKYRSRKLKKENLLLEEKVLQRTNELQKSLNDLKATQTQLIQSEKMASLGELTAGIAHEIQNPLNFINNFSDVNNELIEELKGELTEGNNAVALSIAADIKENEKKINHHGKRADAIVKGMLQHSRTSTGKREPTNISELADEYLRLSYHGLRAKDSAFNSKFTTDFDATVGNIDVVPQDIGRVLLNLFNNAFYAVNEKKKASNLKGEKYDPTVWVTTQLISSPLKAERLEIRVKDNGNGVPKNLLEKIYQPFFTTKPTGQGTGLGLSLSYDIIKAHGGELKVETKEGEGAEFIIELPSK